MAIFQDLMSKDYIEIARQFQVNPKHCDNPKHYEDYIWQNCITDHKQGMGVTHVFVDEEYENKGVRIAGYITLRGSSLIMESEGAYKLGYPALEIAELAVDKRYEGKMLGTDMVKFAINEAVELNSDRVGFQYVILCADPCAVGFYENKNLGFRKIQTYQGIPREFRNKDCTPMMLKITDL